MTREAATEVGAKLATVAVAKGTVTTAKVNAAVGWASTAAGWVTGVGRRAAGAKVGAGTAAATGHTSRRSPGSCSPKARPCTCRAFA